MRSPACSLCRVSPEGLSRKFTSLVGGMLATIVFLLAACGAPSPGPPDVRINPAPTQAYEIVLTIPDPPSQVHAVSGQVQFDIEGVKDDCMPYADRIAGIKPKSSFLVPVDFRRREDGTYTGSVYLDWLIDEDYYGLGVCRWKLTGVTADFRTGLLERFAVLRGPQVLAQATQPGLCDRSMVARDVCLTNKDREVDISAVDLESSFVVTMTSRKKD